ncbi:hypothetical protein EB796_004177 [Bugula neritina]|uniref:Costars domain-containing protein n=1 Tax=Bugula neritina TaxID=10212 RepID=A0A7J7KGW5_BUGNE|nr:hypothetical protein EB796_004177 [Bugula neritina]
MAARNSGIGDQPTSGRPKYNIYPDPLPPPPPDDPNQPIKALGINRAANHAWDGASSHFIDFNDKNETYGRPPEGSLTEQRAKKACQHINNEVLTLVSVIRGIGDHDETNPNIVRVTFGKLFNYYTSISNKVAGILLRARRWKLVDFSGEMLYQGQDDGKIITLLVGPDVIPTTREYKFLDQDTDSPPETLKEKLRKINEQIN